MVTRRLSASTPLFSLGIFAFLLGLMSLYGFFGLVSLHIVYFNAGLKVNCIMHRIGKVVQFATAFLSWICFLRNVLA